MRFIYEALIKSFPGDPVAIADMGYTTHSVDLTTNSFTRTSGSFLTEGSQRDQEVHAFGFNTNDGTYRVIDVQETSLKVAEKLVAGDENTSGSKGNEALTLQGSRGVLRDRFFNLKIKVDAATDAAEALLGSSPSAGFDTLFNNVLAQRADGDPNTPTPQTLRELFAAYFQNRSQDIDDGIRNWGIVGLASTKALFDPHARRDLQNHDGKNIGNDVDPAQVKAAGDIRITDVILRELDVRRPRADHSAPHDPSGLR